MSNIFDVIDPRGCRVICTEDQWNTHVLRRHTWMAGMEVDVEETITNPFIICQDSDYEDRNIYYRRPGSDDHYIKAVVSFNGTSGHLVSAFLSDAGKSGEKLIWPISNNL